MRVSLGIFTTTLLGCLPLVCPAMADVARLGTEFQVNTFTPEDQADPKVSADAAGGFVVVWARHEP